MTVQDTITFHVTPLRQQECFQPIKEAVAELIGMKRAAGKSARYGHNLELRLGRFSTTHGNLTPRHGKPSESCCAYRRLQICARRFDEQSNLKLLQVVNQVKCDPEEGEATLRKLGRLSQRRRCYQV